MATATSPSTRSTPPFDDINVRKAVIANANRTDLRNTRGGELTGPVATHFLPPDFPGFEQAGGLGGLQTTSTTSPTPMAMRSWRPST